MYNRRTGDSGLSGFWVTGTSKKGKVKKILFIILYSLFMSEALMAQGTPETAIKGRKQQVYMFGVATSMNDSLTIITDLQTVQAYVLPNGFLADRSLYSLQLNNYMVGKQQRENMTCAVFFNKNKKKAEKKYQRVRKKFREKHDIIVRPLGKDMFRFEPEEWTQ